MTDVAGLVREHEDMRELAERTLRWLEGDGEFRNKDGTRRPQLFHGCTTMELLARALLSLAEQHEELTRVRELLRVTMLETKCTEERATFEDGFHDGLHYAIGEIDRALRAEEDAG